jgi:Family of unknown function (DUF6335)
MAKRKAVRGSGRKQTAQGKSGRRRRAAAKKTAGSRKIARKATKKAARKAAKKTIRKATKTARATKKAAVRRAKPAARPRVARKKTSTVRKAVAVKGKTKAVKKPTAARTSSTAASAKRTAAKDARQVARTAPGLNRERRTIADDELLPSLPSSLDLDRSASAARSGRRELLEKYEEHTETSPALTGGDVDADWESAYSVGDEAPGGDNPTPDQDIVDDIGRAVGVEYQDNEELKGEKKIIERDKHRWELDPASSDDWEDR